MAELKVGMRLYHKMGVVRECELIRIYYEVDGCEKLDVRIFEKVMVAGEKEARDVFCGISSKGIGEFLFFEKEDAELPLEILATMPDYVEYNNKKIIKISDENTRRKINYESEVQNITEVLEERNIKHLVYFTRLENLKSILENGIVPEKYQLGKGICSIKNNCKKRYPFQVEGNGYSVEFPNYKLLNLLRDGNNPNDSYVILRLEAKSVLLDTIGKQVYCLDNALTSNDKYGDRGLNELFLPEYHKEGYVYNDEYQKEIHNYRDKLNIPDNYTTNPQAEVEICTIVEPKYIKQVVFENNNDKQSWLESNGVYQNGSVEFIVDSKLFGPRFDYQFWQ